MSSLTGRRRAHAPALTLACIALVGCAATEPVTRSSARSASSFTNSVGINTHVGYTDTAYGRNWPLVRDRLAELGIRHVRDTTYRDGTKLVDVVPRLNELRRLGIKGNLLSGHPQGAYGSGTIDEHLAWVKRNVLSFTESLEGPNEYDYPERDANWSRTLRSYQCEWAQKIRADPRLSAKIVVGPSSQSQKGFDTALGDLTACLDRGNIHPYPGGQSPDRTNHGDLSVSMKDAMSTSGTKPLWSTESGYHNAINCLACDHLPVSERAAGVYLPRMFLESFRRGIPRTYAYELLDERPDPEKVDPERNFGLLRNDGSRKPAFVALRNLLTILADKGSAGGRLSYSLRCSSCSEPLRHVLLRKSSGAYYLAVWRESSVWGMRPRTDVSSSPEHIDLRISSPLKKLELYEPSRSTAPTDRTKSSSYRIALTDRILLFKITPVAAQPARRAKSLPRTRPRS